MHKAAGDVRAAQQINTVVRERLSTVAGGLNQKPATNVQSPSVDQETAAARVLAGRDHGAPRTGGSVLPPKIQPARKPTLTQQKTDRGTKR